MPGYLVVHHISAREYDGNGTCHSEDSAAVRIGGNPSVRHPARLIALGAGLMAGSIALVGFGFDSLIEVTSGTVLLWRLRADVDEAHRDRIEAISVRLVGVCFMLLALYVTYDSIKSLIRREAPEESIVGIGLAAVSVFVMPLLVRAKRKVAHGVNSGALMADSKQTELCTYLSAILFLGLLLNAVFGWWWADPVAVLIMVPIIVKEGIEGLRGETCCDDECGPAGS